MRAPGCTPARDAEEQLQNDVGGPLRLVQSSPHLKPDSLLFQR